VVEAQLEARAEKEGITVHEAKMSTLEEKMPSKEFVMPNEVGAMVVYLCSEEARQVTGSTLTIDGGWTTR
jgi:3-hydroxybutyrate dehydrogenase